jgi:hypothetical protein
MTRTATALIANMNALITAVEAETDLLRRGRFGDLADASAAKQQAASGYERALKALAAESGAVKSWPDLLRRDLRAAARRLEIVLGDNSRMIAANREASTRLIGRIIEAAGQVSAAGGYTAAGTLAAEPAAVSAFRERV